MITLGTNGVHIFLDRGISIDNRGTIIFNGYCNIGNNSYLQTGEGGTFLGQLFYCIYHITIIMF